MVIRNHAEVKDIHGFPTSFLDHLEQARKEKDRRLVRSYDVKDDGTFKKFSHKKDITCELYYNVSCGDVADMNLSLPRKDYTLLIANIPYGFRMAGSSYDDEPFKFKQLQKMVKDFALMMTTSLWRIVVFHSMDQGYSVAQALRSRCHRIENLTWYGNMSTTLVYILQ